MNHFKKISAAAVIFLFSLFSIPQNIYAGKEFETSFFATYTISERGETFVTQNIKLTNKHSNIYATQYALEIGSSRIENVTAFDKAGNSIKHSITNTDNKTVIVVNFDNKVVGKGQTQDFTVKYKNIDVAANNGKILEINIPKVSRESDIDAYQVSINVPLSFGQPKTITPSNFKQTQQSNSTILSFDSNQVKDSGITAIFGDQQVYSFEFIYNLENPTVSNAITQVALPPDTQFQKVYYESIQPNPQKVELDEDGNWIATFKLEPKERVSVSAVGSAIVYMDPLISIPQTPEKKLDDYLKSQKFWDTGNKMVKQTASEHNTPESIYNYLVDNYSYNYDRIESGVSRLGAVNALEYPDNAICTEFTDSFIALARAAGIPTRELNGYAHTENSVLKPLSLVQDVLHAWPEYYDRSQGLWKPVDPTWGNTTGGIDYFNSLDFNHFVFAIHGSSSERPYPAGYYKFQNSDSKDLIIDFSTEIPSQRLDFEVSFSSNVVNPFSDETVVKIFLKNRSNIALYNQKYQLFLENAILVENSDKIIPILLPYAEEEISVKIKPTDQDVKIILKIDEKSYESKIEKKVNLKQISFIAGGIALAIIITLIAIKSWSLLVRGSKR